MYMGSYICQNSLDSPLKCLCFVSKLHLNKVVFKGGKSQGYYTKMWPWALTCFTNSLADINTVRDKAMTVFSSEKPVQLFLKRQAQ